MTQFGEVERVFVAQAGAVLVPPFNPPLPNGGTVNLATLVVNLEHDRDGVLLQAVVNWSATFASNVTNAVLGTSGSADVAFEILRNGEVIYRVTDTAVQKEITVASLFTGSTTTSVVTPLLFLDFSPFCSKGDCITYTLRATNIVITPPVLVPPAAGPVTGIAVAGVGAVTFVAEEIEGKHCKHCSAF